MKHKTLGEYRDLCAMIGGEDCRAVAFLDAKIVEHRKGRDEKVWADESQMLMFLGPMMLEKTK